MGRWLPVPQPPVWGSLLPRLSFSPGNDPLSPDCFSSQSHMLLTGSLLETHRMDQAGWSPQ